MSCNKMRKCEERVVQDVLCISSESVSQAKYTE